jgi:hypothetical protein
MLVVEDALVFVDLADQAAVFIVSCKSLWPRSSRAYSTRRCIVVVGSPVAKPVGHLGFVLFRVVGEAAQVRTVVAFILDAALLVIIFVELVAIPCPTTDAVNMIQKGRMGHRRSSISNQMVGRANPAMAHKASNHLDEKNVQTPWGEHCPPSRRASSETI